MLRKRRILRKPKKVLENCGFCKGKIEPDYQESALLTKYLTERGKILSRDNTGLCSHHQKEVTRAIKQARHLALLPFIVRV